MSGAFIKEGLYPKVLKYWDTYTTTFPFVPNGKWWFLGVPIFKYIIIRLECCHILGHLKIIHFLFGTNGKLIILGVPILKHITVVSCFSVNL